MPVIADAVFRNGVPVNGATINAYKASRFGAVPAENAAAPGGAADAGPVTTGASWGGEGEFQITVPTVENYYLSAASGGLTSWQFYPASGGGGGAVSSVFARTGAVVTQTGDYSVADVTGAAPIASPALTGNPTAPTQPALNNSTRLATTAYADMAVGVELARAEAVEVLLAPKASPTFTGTVTVPVSVNATDPTQKVYVDAISTAAVGSARAAVRAVATTNITLSAPQTIDGYAAVATDRILAVGQSTASQNGLWMVAAGAWTRPTDFAAASAQVGLLVPVEAGTANASTVWLLTGTGVTVDTTAQTWVAIVTGVSQRSLTYSGAGVQTVRVGTIRLYFPVAGTLLGALAGVGTAPTGASLIVDVRKNATTVYTGGTNRPTITDSTFVSAIPVMAPAIRAMAAGDYLTVDVAQIGSTIAGSDLVVQILYSVP